jgi:hypothetical protein
MGNMDLQTAIAVVFGPISEDLDGQDPEILAVQPGRVVQGDLSLTAT